MRLLVLPILLLLACTSGSFANPDPDQYLDRVRQMHAEYKERFGHLTRVTLAVTPRPETPGPIPTLEEWQQEFLPGMAVILADFSRVNRFQRDGLDELRSMVVPQEHEGIHYDLIELWEAGIAWTNRWMVETENLISAAHNVEWGYFDVETDEEISAYSKIHARHVDAWARVDFVLLGTPEPPPYDIQGSATAWALTPFPEIPTATLGPSPTPMPGSTSTGEYGDSTGRKEALTWFAEAACGPEKLDLPTIGWPKLEGELSWTMLLLRHDIPRGLGGFRDVLWDYYETLKIFAEKQDRTLKVDEALFMSDQDVVQKRMAVIEAFEALPEPDQLALKGAGCGFD